ncbi:EF-hand domain-containing protein [Sulfurifustis variabilis]|nr:EF-hand domain-containing protein [Sulfurifustis variabilis]
MNATRKVFLTLAFCAVPMAAFAADVGSGARDIPGGSSDWPSFSEIDTNNSGLIEQGEAESVRGLGFVSSDTNGDALLDRQEYEAARRGTPVTGGDGGGAPTVSGGGR